MTDSMPAPEHNVAAQRDVEHRAHLAAAAERDEAVSLCATLQSALLSRLAELTEAAGKQRSTEWLRTCARLPMGEWPPAPAYKGPMVPAAELEQAKAELRTERIASYNMYARVFTALGCSITAPWSGIADAAGKVRAERDQLRQRIVEARALNGDVVRQVDKLLGHRYHIPGLHYSIPHVAEKAAAEIAQLQARLDTVSGIHERDVDDNCVVCCDDAGSPMAYPCDTVHALDCPEPEAHRVDQPTAPDVSEEEQP